MVDLVPDSTKSYEKEGSCERKEKKKKKKVVLRIEWYHHKRLPSFEDKSRAYAYAELRFDIGGLV
ncbi:hypothetical protein D8674_036835 [Pyrus ussuriensis x Pyrus communis]|uniref:Uncharacterized protein n=1 Tax=Pyrus ussuriensis x Pyrus communis TaxID=2448454 RepID=A0A5N5G9M0_9ROSA|nr:hypothetical protein D8674_036835 [Pyrus ussuriensis x Pyrus communis]